MAKPLNLKVDRFAKMTLESGVLEPGARLPSWQASCPARRHPGTVRAAYEKLRAAQLIIASRATGTRIAPRPRAVVKSERTR